MNACSRLCGAVKPSQFLELSQATPHLNTAQVDELAEEEVTTLGFF